MYVQTVVSHPIGGSETIRLRAHFNNVTGPIGKSGGGEWEVLAGATDIHVFRSMSQEAIAVCPSTTRCFWGGVACPMR
jgi:hypothetical protein